ncbi:unnamed protein product [Symbiodinium natans]|uniref:Uncharacterized protein n=1 Tax=Symbiodinium natans TaxID=878477 RepID=A0A812JNV8_9DINO|nr:unnamed protein product [Symbiodinium natans]
MLSRQPRLPDLSRWLLGAILQEKPGLAVLQLNLLPTSGATVAVAVRLLRRRWPRTCPLRLHQQLRCVAVMAAAMAIYTAVRVTRGVGPSGTKLLAAASMEPNGEVAVDLGARAVAAMALNPAAEAAVVKVMDVPVAVVAVSVWKVALSIVAADTDGCLASLETCGPNEGLKSHSLGKVQPLGRDISKAKAAMPGIQVGAAGRVAAPGMLMELGAQRAGAQCLVLGLLSDVRSLSSVASICALSQVCACSTYLSWGSFLEKNGHRASKSTYQDVQDLHALLVGRSCGRIWQKPLHELVAFAFSRVEDVKLAWLSGR